MGTGPLPALSSAEELGQKIKQEDFAPVKVEAGGRAIRFEYSSKRENIWLVGGVISFMIAAALAAVISIPFGFLITAVFVVLARATDDHLLLDLQRGTLCRRKNFFGREARDQIVRLPEVTSVLLVPIEHTTGGAHWTEYSLKLKTQDGRTHPMLTHTESRSRPRAQRLGQAVAAYLNVPLSQNEASGG